MKFSPWSLRPDGPVLSWLKSSKAREPRADQRVHVSLAQLRALEFRSRGFSFLPRQPATSALSGRHGSRLRGRGLNFEELRHYRPGDDIRCMDWKVSNRTGKPHVRVYTEERERSVQLLVDQRVSMFFGSRHAMKSVVAAEVAALAAWRVIASGDRLGGIVIGDRQAPRIPAQRSKDNVIALLARIADANAALAAGQKPQPAALNQALEQLARDGAHDALVIYIGDGFGWDSRSEELVKGISQHNDFVVAQVYDLAETALPALDELVVSDGELQIAVAGTEPRLRQRFADSYSDNTGRMLGALRRQQLSLISINTTEDPLQQLLSALGGRR